MKRIIKNTAGLAFALPAFIGTAKAQVEVLSPPQIAAYEEQLPAARNTAVPANFKTYLQRLQPNQTSPREIANAVRVANDMKSSPLPASAFFGHYVVPAMSPLMRLPDAYPTDGQFTGEVRVALAQDQYETASFQMYAFKDLARVNLKVSALQSEDGSTLAPENVDLKVVKVWYQNGNAWLSYFADPGLKLVPELLLHDENLIRVDTQKQANYARIRDAKDTREVWISAPQKIDVGFDPYQDGFADAKTLQPVSLQAGQFKQFVLSVHATVNTKPGVYRGNIAVTAEGRQPAFIPVAVRVLPFVLPLPKTNYDLNKDFVVSLYSVWPTLGLDSKAFLPTLKNMRAHNLLHVGPSVSYDATGSARANSWPAPEQAAKQVWLTKEAGFLTKPIMDAGGLPWVSHDFDGLMQMKRVTQKYRDFYQKNFGHTDVVVRQGDENGAAWLVDERAIWRVVHQQGLKSGLATKTANSFPTSAYAMDWRPLATTPGDAATANQWAQIGNGYTGFYANQHNGSENPAFVRRQHGLLGYLSNFDMVDNYQFAYGPWNDRAWPLYKPMVLAYPISDGLVDTLAWEGFRAGIDDIRYATKLRQLANVAIASGDLDRVEAGRKVRQWLAMMDGSTADLNTVRLEMIEKIEELAGLEGR
jgi:hypothetical protein